MNDKVTQHLKALLGDDYTVELQLQIEEQIIDSNLSTIKSKLKKLTGKSEYTLWKENATPEEIEAKRKASREYYQQHKDEWKAKYYQTMLDYQERNKEQLQAYRKEYYADYRHTNPVTDERKEKIREYRRNRYHKNKEKVLSEVKAYYAKNREKILEEQRIRYQKNKQDLEDYYRIIGRETQDKPYTEGDEKRTDNF